jgi:hypothetical protein
MNQTDRFWSLVRQNIIGRDAVIRTPFGERRATYADYTASGRGLRFIERYLDRLLEPYGNTHTEGGTGTTGAVHRLQQILGLHLPPAGSDMHRKLCERWFAG